MIRETIEFEKDDHYSVDVVELNHKIFALTPTITLKTSYLPATLFQTVIDHLMSMNKYDIKRVYFDNVRVNYRFISFQLFGHIRGKLKVELRRPLDWTELTTGKDDYKWMEDEFLPRIPDELETDLYYLEKKIKNMYRAFRRGKIKGVPYELEEDYKVVYNYFFDVDPTDIKPVFEVYVNTKTPDIKARDPEEIRRLLLGKFQKLNVRMVFS